MHKILIIEDEADIAENLAYNLRRAGFEVAVAESGEKGLLLALNKADSPPSLLVLDVMLPGMSGNELCRRLRRERRMENTPIIILSAKATEADIKAGFDAGADDYIAKPYSIKMITARVNNLLNREEENLVVRA